MRVPSERRLSGPITTAIIEKMPPDARTWDGKIGGLVVVRLAERHDGRVRASFRVRVDLPRAIQRQRIDGSRTVERVVGKFPDDGGIHELRRRAADAIALIKRGGDPKSGSDPATGPTLAQGIADYMQHLQTRRRPARPRTLEAYRYASKLLPKGWGTVPMTKIAAMPNRLSLRQLHEQITSERGKGSADVALAFLLAVIKHAAKFHDLPAIPRGIVEWHGSGSRAHTGFGLAGVAAWHAKVQGLGDPILRELLWFILLTGLRSTEAAEARRVDLDPEGRTLTTVVKGGARRVVPLGTAAMACAQEAMRLHDDPRVFAGKRQDPAGVAGVVYGHSLRHSFASIGREIGLGEGEIAALLGHQSGEHAMTARYGQQAQERLRALADRIGEAVEAHLSKS